MENVEWHGKLLYSLQAFGEQVAWDVIEEMEYSIEEVVDYMDKENRNAASCLLYRYLKSCL